MTGSTLLHGGRKTPSPLRTSSVESLSILPISSMRNAANLLRSQSQLGCLNFAQTFPGFDAAGFSGTDIDEKTLRLSVITGATSDILSSFLGFS